MNRKTFTASPHTLGLLAAAHPALDHFHAVEVVDCHDGPREVVWHFGIIRDGGMVEVVDERGVGADDLVAADFARVVGDEWHA